MTVRTVSRCSGCKTTRSHRCVPPFGESWCLMVPKRLRQRDVGFAFEAVSVNAGPSGESVKCKRCWDFLRLHEATGIQRAR